MPTYEIVYSRIKVSDKNEAPLSNPTKAYDYLMKNCFSPADMWRESAWAVFLDNRNAPIGKILISIGGINATWIDTKLVVKSALDSFAKGVILSHNHPSSDPMPGHKDILETDKLRKALAFFDIELTDHIVVTEESFYSFKEEVAIKVPNVTVKS